MRIDTSGRLLVGTSSSSAEAKFIVQGGATAAGGAINIQRNATTASAGSTIGFINFANSANNVGATISADGDGTWSAGTSHPTRLAFSTTADGASSPTERARLNNLGYLTGTVNGLGSGLYLANQFYRLNSGNVGSNATGAQSVFGVGVSLIADTVYAFESFYVLQKSAGTTSHTVAVSFGGTAGLNNINYGIIWNRDNTAAASSNMTGIAGAYQSFATAASSLVLTSAIASANQTITLKLSGTVSISTAGTFVPQYALSFAPGGAYTTLAGSYFKIAALGAAGANTSIGSWA
ncbi:hypothetical protein EBT25_03120 [bacterium]|nr:hypothetical protein [bacterium]